MWFKIIYGMSVLLVPVVQNPLGSGRCVSSPKNSQVQEIDLFPIPVRSVNHTKSLDGKSKSLAGVCETEIFYLKGVTKFIEIPSPSPVVYMHINDL